MAAVQRRLIEWLAYQRNRQTFRKRSEMVVKIVREIEAAGQFTAAHCAFDNGVRTLEKIRQVAAGDRA